MPLSHRKGIENKKARKDDERRREAKENGIVLERSAIAKRGRGGREDKRERGIGAPSVGRFKGGTLTLSQSDVRGITGAGSRGRGRGRGGKRGGGRGRR